ncbi:outer membrane beta-barrel protein [Mariprofundus ferrooxydans]|uniref:outer membrane beta-barrel protein n=1 Tax=Mariprofundus ferrooxydans TaxID=314344 RepID=UPI001431586C|nr:outer membrane beta-barrel protein [Mariprofundus ferrooxydans]
MKKIVFYMSMFSIFFSATALHAQEIKVYAALEAGTYTVKYVESGISRGFSTVKSGIPAGILRVGLDYGYFGGELRFGLMKTSSRSYPAGTLGKPAPFTLDFRNGPFFSYLGKVQYPVTRSFNVYALLGGTLSKFSINPLGNGTHLDYNAVKTGLSYGFGVEYKPRPLFAVGLEWMQYWTNVETSLSNGNRSNTTFGGFGLSFRRSFDLGL